MSGTFSENPYYREYEHLLLELHRLFLGGKADGPEADLIRDLMDIPASHLSGEEADRLGGLSGDLYQIEGRELFIPLPSEETGSFATMVDEVASQDEWAQLLDLLRKRPAAFPDDLVAETRGKAYWRLSHPAAALKFASFAVKQNPGNGAAKFLELDLLSEVGAHEEALARISTYTVTSPEDLWWLARAVPLLLRSGETGTFTALWKRVRDGLRAILADTSATVDCPSTLLASAKVALVLAHLELGERLEAGYWFRELASRPEETAEAKEFVEHLRGLFGNSELPQVDDWARLIRPGILAHLAKDHPARTMSTA